MSFNLATQYIIKSTINTTKRTYPLFAAFLEDKRMKEEESKCLPSLPTVLFINV